MEVKEYKEWCLKQISVDDGIEVSLPDDDHILMTTKYAAAEIVFYDHKIVELIVRHGEENIFYLHFQLGDEEHAMGLFHEMKQSLLSVQENAKYRVLLTCSSALTTSYFASELNRMSNLLNEDLEFHAVSIDRVYAAAIDYDMVLIAPQESFTYEQIQKVLTDKVVRKIPTRIFAGYKASELIEFVKNEKKAVEEVPEYQERIEFDIHSAFSNNYRILTMGLINHKDSYRFGYRIYDHGKPTLDKEVIKKSFAHDDIIDLLDYIVARHKSVDAIGIALAGIAFHGHLYHPLYGYENDNLGEFLTKRYNIPVVLINDVNAVALGYHALNENTENMVFYFQPVGFSAAGAGVIINGKLVTGRLHAAGEMKYDILPQFPRGDQEMETAEGTLNVLCAGLRAYIATIAPQKLIVNCMMVPDVDKIRGKLSQYFPEEYLPDIEHVYRFKKYMLPGIMIHTMEVIFNKNDWFKNNSHRTTE